MRPRWFVPVATLSLAGGSMLAFAGTAAASSAAVRSDHVNVAIRSGQVRAVSGSRHLRVLLGGRAYSIQPFIRRGHNAVTSENWSGYAAHNGPYKSISASWVEPRGHCSGPGHKYSSFWVGLDGFNSSTVEQTGSSLNCKNGRPRYFAWYEMFPKFPVTFHNAVRPGDHFHGSVTYNGGGRFTLKLSDRTRHWTRTAHKSLRSARRASAEVIIEAPSTRQRVLPLADFGTVHISGAKVNGSKIGSRHPAKVIMQFGGRRKVTVSRLTNGRNFGVTWRHS